MSGIAAGLAAQLRNCVAPAERAHSLPPTCYADPAITATEISAIFRKAWVGVGRADRFKSPGDYDTMDIAGAPVIVLRDKENRLRAFGNSCRHRGARLLDGSGNCRGIRCPFHNWTYKLDGRLAGAPRMEEALDFDKAEYGLVEFRVSERAGFAFVCFDEAAPDVDVYLGDFEAVHAPWLLDRLVTTRRRTLEVACNWKAFLEVFNEGYHLPYVHAGSINDLYGLPERPDETTGSYGSQFSPTTGTGALLSGEQNYALPPMPGLKGREANGVRYTWAFPNMTFAAGTDSVWIYEAYPNGPDRCHVVQTLCFPQETIALPDFEDRAAHYYRRMDEALEEDREALENQQRGLGSPFSRPGRFSPLLEPTVANFARWYADQLLSA